MRARFAHAVKAFILLLIFLYGPGISAQTQRPEINISHAPIDSAPNQQRLTLPFEVYTQLGIRQARCYFQSDLDAQWSFVIARFDGMNRYLCELPIVAPIAKWLDYRLLVIDHQDAVIRSQAFQIQLTPDKALPLPNLKPITVYDELRGNYLPWTNDPAVTTSAIGDDRHRYGLIAGLYTAAQIPAWLGAQPGYFGGFEIDLATQSVFAIKGFAPGLSPVESRPLLAPDTKLFALPLSTTPNIDGDDWSGYFKTTGFNNRHNLTANVDQTNSNVTLTTTKSGLAHRFVGTINSSGHMLVYDQYDGEDWTTHLGPATSTRINIYDFIRPPTASDPNPPLNSVILSRTLIVIPGTPSSINADDGISIHHINVSWSSVSNASYYLVYRCNTTSTSSCNFIKNTANLSTRDDPGDIRQYYYRVRACNSKGCSGYSAADPGKLATVNIVGSIMLLLFD